MTYGRYGQSTAPKRRGWTTTDPRYGSYRWRVKTRPIVLRRDRYRCWAAGCERKADVCDHVKPVYPGMPDLEFYGLHNLRASCRAHNLARALLSDAELGGTSTSGPYTRKRRIW